MKSDRLFEITTVLLNKEKVTAQELAERFGVSTRTIYRDVEVLSAAGIPVYMNKGAGGGIRLLENYALKRTLISERESATLLMAIKTLQATAYPELDKLLEKLGALFRKSAASDWVEVDFTPWGSSPHDQNKFGEIKRAILDCNLIRFDYVNGEGRKSNRLVEPAKLIFKSNAWYLGAYCRQQQQQRTFKIARIKNLEVLTETFARLNAPGATIREAPESPQPLLLVKLRCQAAVLNRIYDYFDDAAIQPDADGQFILEAALPEGEWLYGYILSMGSSVEVLEPEQLREAVIHRMRRMLEIYRSPM